MDVESKIDKLIENYCEAFESFSSEVEGFEEWHYSLDDLSLEFKNHSESKKYEIIPIGTYSPERNSFLWAWANEDFAGSIADSALALKELESEFGFRAFSSKGFPCKQNDLDEILAISMYGLKGRTVFKEKSNNPWLFLCVK